VSLALILISAEDETIHRLPGIEACREFIRIEPLTDGIGGKRGARTTGLRLGRPAGRANNSVIVHCRLSLAGRRIAYFTSRSSSASYSSGLAKAASPRKTTSLPCAC
jgi:hypothetical protein